MGEERGCCKKNDDWIWIIIIAIILIFVFSECCGHDC